MFSLKKNRAGLSTTRTIMLSFLIAIAAGTILLSLPFSQAGDERLPFLDVLFTATTSVCVTGLVTVPTFSAWSLFGKIVILILIQMGGLGIITIMSGIMIGMHKRIGIGDRMLLQDAFNLNTMSGIIIFIKKVLIGTAVVEGTGALLYMTVFVPQYGPKGIWYSVFTAISAFCNAGIDILGDDSLCSYVTNPIINFTSSLMIILGGLGYVVWWDLLRVMKNIKREGIACFRRLTLQSKMVIFATVFLIVVGAIFIFIFEYNNPDTIGNMTLAEKIEVSFFQSITTRTAGFASVPQENLTNSSAILCLVFMFIGGSPVGTAGGVKTVTVFVLVASVFATIFNKNEVVFFNRQITKDTINKSISVIFMSFMIMFISTLLLSAVTDASVIDVLFETVSATATVGLTRALTGTLGVAGKMIIICTMYLGRIGPISLAVAFNTRVTKANLISHPVEEISVG